MKNNGGGKARYSTMEKRPASYNQHFNTYSKQVDTLKSLEYGTHIGLIGVGSIKKAVKLVKNPTLSNVKNFLKELFLPIAAAIALFNWIKAYDKAVKSWQNIPGTKYRV